MPNNIKPKDYITMDITSLQNPRIKHLIKLRDDKKQRKLENLMLVEGWDEINLALLAGYIPHSLFIAPEISSRKYDIMSSETFTITKSVFEKVSYRENPDGWLAVFPNPTKSLINLKLNSNPLLIVAESIEKPGNLGAILRTADAAGVDALLVCDPHTDIYNPNVVRASRGTLFTIPTIELSNMDAFSYLRENQIALLAATPQADEEYTRMDLSVPLAVIVGTEDDGLSDFWLQKADLKVKIPMAGKVNSLNVSIATALIVYEAKRQRER
jgi:TrmH family RNA methyltransferase